jgi:hypothetical protein
VSCWGTGDLRQYDVFDPFAPKLTGSLRIGCMVSRAPHPAGGGSLNGGPQMVEVSRDGKRIYFTNSLYGAIDPQFYPDGIKGWMVRVDAQPAGGDGTSPGLLHPVAGRLPATSGPAAGGRRVVGLVLLPVTIPWPWVALVGLGAFHGVNPAMGWLFAVALGLHRRSRAVVLASVIPIALGHSLAVALVVLAVAALSLTVDPRVIRIAGGSAPIGWALYHRPYGARHRVRIGMRAGMAGLALWSFLMASAHGAGLMLLPLLVPLAGIGGHAGHTLPGASLTAALVAVGLHTFAMLTVTAVVALVVYDWVGVGFLRRGWVNLAWVWVGALLTTGLLLIVTT